MVDVRAQTGQKPQKANEPLSTVDPTPLCEASVGNLQCYQEGSPDSESMPRLPKLGVKHDIKP